MRQQNYAVTFDRQLGAAKAQKGEAADREAKRVAFYIFWNTKGDTDRRPLAPLPRSCASASHARHMRDCTVSPQGPRSLRRGLEPVVEALPTNLRRLSGPGQRRGFKTAAARDAPAGMARAAPHCSCRRTRRFAGLSQRCPVRPLGRHPLTAPEGVPLLSPREVAGCSAAGCSRPPQ